MWTSVGGRLEWSGVEWSGVEWSGVEWSGVEWSGVGMWSGVGLTARIGRNVCWIKMETDLIDRGVTPAEGGVLYTAAFGKLARHRRLIAGASGVPRVAHTPPHKTLPVRAALSHAINSAYRRTRNHSRRRRRRRRRRRSRTRARTRTCGMRQLGWCDRWRRQVKAGVDWGPRHRKVEHQEHCERHDRSPWYSTSGSGGEAWPGTPRRPHLGSPSSTVPSTSWPRSRRLPRRAPRLLNTSCCDGSLPLHVHVSHFIELSRFASNCRALKPATIRPNKPL